MGSWIFLLIGLGTALAILAAVVVAVVRGRAGDSRGEVVR